MKSFRRSTNTPPRCVLCDKRDATCGSHTTAHIRNVSIEINMRKRSSYPNPFPLLLFLFGPKHTRGFYLGANVFKICVRVRRARIIALFVTLGIAALCVDYLMVSLTSLDARCSRQLMLQTRHTQHTAHACTNKNVLMLWRTLHTADSTTHTHTQRPETLRSWSLSGDMHKMYSMIHNTLSEKRVCV